MNFICPYSKKPVNPEHCLGKRESKPLIGTRDLFADCRVCSAHIPTENKAKKKIRQDSPVLSVGSVETTVPIPPSLRKGKVSFTTYPFDSLKPGDSFAVTYDRKNSRRASSALTQAARHFRLKHHPDWEFTVRTTPEEIRIWRTK